MSLKPWWENLITGQILNHNSFGEVKFAPKEDDFRCCIIRVFVVETNKYISVSAKDCELYFLELGELERISKGWIKNLMTNERNKEDRFKYGLWADLSSLTDVSKSSDNNFTPDLNQTQTLITRFNNLI